MGNSSSSQTDANIAALKIVIDRYEQLKKIHANNPLDNRELYAGLQPELLNALEVVTRGSSPVPIPPIDIPSSTRNRLSALIVDDSHLSCKLASRALESLNIVPKVAYSGDSALAALKHNPNAFDLVLLDIVMPGLDGVEVLSRMKMNPALCRIPVIMLSGLEDKTLAEVCLQQGASQVVIKPLRVDDIAYVVNNHLSNGQNREMPSAQHARLLSEKSINEPENREQMGLCVGTKLPSFTLNNTQNQHFSLQQYFRNSRKRSLSPCLVMIFVDLYEEDEDSQIKGMSQGGIELLRLFCRNCHAICSAVPQSVDQNGYTSTIEVIAVATVSSKTDPEITDGNGLMALTRILASENLDKSIPFQVLYDPAPKGQKRLISQYFGESVELGSQIDSKGRSGNTIGHTLDGAVMVVDKNCQISHKWYGCSKRFKIMEIVDHLKGAESTYSISSNKSGRETSAGHKISTSTQSFPGSNHVTILVVDDSNISSKLAVKKLTSYGHRTISAENGKVALEQLQKDRVAEGIDLILLDIVMPVMDGVELLHILKADLKLKHIHVIMLSGLEDKTLAKVCMDLGATAVLLKPLDSEQVQKVIDSKGIGIRKT